MIAYLIAVRPFKDKHIENPMICGEVFIFFFYVTFLLQLIFKNNFSNSQQDVVCMLIIVSNIGINVVFSIHSSVSTVRNWMKLRNLKKIKPITPMSNIKITEIDQAFGKLNLCEENAEAQNSIN